MSFNVFELDAASNNKVEDIRSIVDQVRIPPQQGKYKVYIIDEVHMLSQAAFNAFLKTLEEPPAHAVFILATTEKHKSCRRFCLVAKFDFHRITVPDAVAHLKHIAAQEGVMPRRRRCTSSRRKPTAPSVMPCRCLTSLWRSRGSI